MADKRDKDSSSSTGITFGMNFVLEKKVEKYEYLHHSIKNEV